MQNISDKVKRQIQDILLHYFAATHPQLIHTHDDVFLADKILSIPELEEALKDAEPQKSNTRRDHQESRNRIA